MAASRRLGSGSDGTVSDDARTESDVVDVDVGSDASNSTLSATESIPGTSTVLIQTSAIPVTGRAGGRGGAEVSLFRQREISGLIRADCPSIRMVQAPVPRPSGGIANVGASCYLNTATHTLFMLPNFRYFMTARELPRKVRRHPDKRVRTFFSTYQRLALSTAYPDKYENPSYKDLEHMWHSITKMLAEHLSPHWFGDAQTFFGVVASLGTMTKFGQLLTGNLYHMVGRYRKPIGTDCTVPIPEIRYEAEPTLFYKGIARKRSVRIQEILESFRGEQRTRDRRVPEWECPTKRNLHVGFTEYERYGLFGDYLAIQVTRVNVTRQEAQTRRQNGIRSYPTYTQFKREQNAITEDLVTRVGDVNIQLTDGKISQTTLRSIRDPTVRQEFTRRYRELNERWESMIAEEFSGEGHNDLNKPIQYRDSEEGDTVQYRTGDNSFVFHNVVIGNGIPVSLKLLAVTRNHNQVHYTVCVRSGVTERGAALWRVINDNRVAIPIPYSHSATIRDASIYVKRHLEGASLLLFEVMPPASPGSGSMTDNAVRTGIMRNPAADYGWIVDVRSGIRDDIQQCSACAESIPRGRFCRTHQDVLDDFRRERPDRSIAPLREEYT